MFNVYNDLYLGKANPAGGGGGSEPINKTKYGATIDSFLGDVNENGVLQQPTEAFSLNFNGVVDLADGALGYKFYYDKKVTSVNFPDLTTVSGQFPLQYAFYSGTEIKSVSFPKLTTISGTSAMQYAFNSCSKCTSYDFSKLATITAEYAFARAFNYNQILTRIDFPALSSMAVANVFQYGFNSSTALEDIYFNALTTTSFGNVKSQFTNMMQNTGTNTTHTIHFPSNIESQVQALTGYPLFGGTSGYVTLAFDLPATS